MVFLQNPNLIFRICPTFFILQTIHTLKDASRKGCVKPDNEIDDVRFVIVVAMSPATIVVVRME